MELHSPNHKCVCAVVAAVGARPRCGVSEHRYMHCIMRAFVTKCSAHHNMRMCLIQMGNLCIYYMCDTVFRVGDGGRRCRDIKTHNYMLWMDIPSVNYSIFQHVAALVVAMYTHNTTHAQARPPLSGMYKYKHHRVKGCRWAQHRFRSLRLRFVCASLRSTLHWRLCTRRSVRPIKRDIDLWSVIIYLVLMIDKSKLKSILSAKGPKHQPVSIYWIYGNKVYKNTQIMKTEKNVCNHLIMNIFAEIPGTGNPKVKGAVNWWW